MTNEDIQNFFHNFTIDNMSDNKIIGGMIGLIGRLMSKKNKIYYKYGRNHPYIILNGINIFVYNLNADCYSDWDSAVILYTNKEYDIKFIIDRSYLSQILTLINNYSKQHKQIIEDNCVICMSGSPTKIARCNIHRCMCDFCFNDFNNKPNIIKACPICRQ